MTISFITGLHEYVLTFDLVSIINGVSDSFLIKTCI